MKIERARAELVEELAAVEAAAFEDAWSADQIAAELSQPRCHAWLARAPRDDVLDVLGYLLSWRVVDERELVRVATMPHARRRGVARALVEALQADARGSGDRCVHLEVGARNAAAIALYEGLGFARVGRRAGYYSDGDDAVLMTWGCAPDEPAVSLAGQ